MDLSKHIELTNLSPVITGREIDQLVTVAIDQGLHGICVPPFWVKRAFREIAGRQLALTTVVGYPAGFQMTETKMLEVELALRDGAEEIDFVMHLSSFASGMPWTKIELAKASHLVHSRWKLLKVIIEVDRWSASELDEVIKLCVDTGVDYIVTNADLDRQVSPREIQQLRGMVPSAVWLKVCCRIGDQREAAALVSAGADRIGTGDQFWAIPPAELS